jgi:hypothetical protein
MAMPTKPMKKSVMGSYGFLLTLLLITVSGGLVAAPENTGNSAEHRIRFAQIQLLGAELQLEAKQAPLVQILKEIADKTGVSIHYSVLPEAPVTATCAGSTVRQIMACLVAGQVGLVAQDPQQDKPAEFWLLGSSVGNCQAVTLAPPTSREPVPTNAASSATQLEPNQEQSDALLAQLKKAKGMGSRVEALANLASGGKINDPNVRKAIEDAITDKDAGIRAQAVATMANLDKGGAIGVLGQALQDSDASVRMTAVDNAAGNVELLEQALADADASVRNYAAAKLAQIKRREQR